MRKTCVTILISFFLITSFSFTAQANSTPSNDPYISFAESLTSYAKRFQGIRYRSGGTTPAGFDCSGFVRFVFAKFNMDIAHSSKSLASLGYAVKKQEAIVGDLIFFGYGTSVSHVGLVVGNDEKGIRFIHSATSKGITISSLNEAYYAKRFISLRRVLDQLRKFYS